MSPPAIQITPKPVRLSPAELDALRAAVAHERPPFSSRLAGPLNVTEIGQPFFARHRVLEVASPMPMPATKIYAIVGPAGTHVLSTHLDNFVSAAAHDPPPNLASADVARPYANLGDAWTSDNEWGDFLVQSFAEIPWKSKLTEEEQAKVKALEAQLGGAITPLGLHAEGDGHVLSKWVVANRRLVARRLIVPHNGLLQRHDEVRAEELPVHPGRLWGFADGRLVPTG